MADQEVTVSVSPKKSRLRDLTTDEAISEVEKLKERVRIFSLSSSVSGESSDGSGQNLCRKQDDLIACLAVMRRLLETSEAESKRLKDEKAAIATRISSSLNAVNREVASLKAELRDQDKRLAELTTNARSQVDGDETGKNNLNVKEENDRLRRENDLLIRELQEWKEGNTSLDELRERLHSKEHEINRCKETISCMKGERQRLKSEKINLLDQLKQVYGILEAKESELRDFIKNYGECMRKSQEQLEQMSNERELCDRDAKHAKIEIEKLQCKLSEKVSQMDLLERELNQVKERLQSPERSPIGLTNDLNIAVSSVHTPSLSDDDRKPHSCAEELPSYLYHADVSTKDESDIPVFESDLESPAESERKLKKRSSFSRLFSRGKQRKFTFPHSGQEYPLNGEADHFTPNSSLSQKRALWEVHKEVPIECWKANMVLAWLEVECRMSMYAQPVYENIKSGRVLLELSDTDLSSGLAITKTMHRRKLRLAIEDYRNPSSVQYPRISSVDHIWLSHTWTKSVGLSQYGVAFETQLIDGRLLNVITRKEMEKYLNVQKKFHQMSILHGIQLLRMVGFDKEVLIKRQAQCEEADMDPLVWTNERVMKWCRSIDLGEYADSLQDSGVHGALMVLEQTFGPNELAQALSIHHSKNIIRRHLTSEFNSLVLPARDALACNHPEFAKQDPQKTKRKRPLSFNAPRRPNVSSDVAAIRHHSFRDSLVFKSRPRDVCDSCPSLKDAPSPILSNGPNSVNSLRPKSYFSD